MSWFKKSKNTITVEFFESGTSDPFSVSEVPSDQLPDTFEAETNLEIGDQQWSVAQAIPNKKEDFIKAGKLKVFLNKIQTISPNEILFSLPTINDTIFETETVIRANLFSIHEDDWRQTEFVSEKFHLEINKEIKGVLEIYENHKIGIGFDKIHIRQLIEQPLQDESINLESFMENFNVINKFDGFGIANNKAKNSFAFQVAEGVIFYGQTDNSSQIIYLCAKDNEKSDQIVERIVGKHNLVFIDWCRAKVTGK